MSNLITKINKKSGKRKKTKANNTSSQVFERLSRWKQWTGKLKNGVGTRFISLQEPTFQDLSTSAVSLFFPNGTNFFGEEEEATDFEMLDCSQSVMDLDQEIAEFLKENGLYASKTFFIWNQHTTFQWQKF